VATALRRGLTPVRTVLDNGAVLFAIDVKTGKEVWREGLGTIAKASPVYADGKLYIGTENTGDAGGKFYVLEANPNPQLAYGEDFAESAERAGLSYEALLERIVSLGLAWRPDLI